MGREMKVALKREEETRESRRIYRERDMEPNKVEARKVSYASMACQRVERNDTI